VTNLAPPPARPAAAALLEDLRVLRRDAAPLPGLDPATYARDHAAFEARSDQRDLIAAHLGERLAGLGDGPLSVLSVGCGDGSLDSRLAAGLLRAVPDRRLRYVGVDPWAESATSWAAAMAALDAGEGLDADVHVSSFADAPLGETFGVVVFVHSIYYVADVAETLRTALRLVEPGGQLWVLNAPRAELNALVDVLAPPLEGHRQWFSDDVAQAFVDAAIDVDDVQSLEALVDLAGASDDVVDFAVQARLSAALRPPVQAYLDAVAVHPAGSDAQGVGRVPHPVTVFAATRAVLTPGEDVVRSR
jgi:SAM-dependent methyltransferase